MRKTKHLDALKKGEITYDYQHDILIFRIKDRDYKCSVELQNFVIDIDTENFVTGIRIFDASKVSGIDKIALQNMKQGKFEASIQDNVINVRFNFVGTLRNKLIPFISEKEHYTQQFTTHLGTKQQFENSEVIAAGSVA